MSKLDLRWQSALEIVAFVALLFGSKMVFDPIAWQFSGPMSMIFSLVVLAFYLKYRDESWTPLGLVRLSTWRSKLLLLPQALLGMVGIIGISAALFIAAQNFEWTIFTDAQEIGADRWGDMKGNLGLYLLWLSVVWTSAAFGEEVFFRGFIISRAERLFKGVPGKILLSVVMGALVFGYAHFYYQGLRGFIATGLIGLWMGILFVAYKRNLWPLILAHGFVDSLMFTAHYMDWDI